MFIKNIAIICFSLFGGLRADGQAPVPEKLAFCSIYQERIYSASSDGKTLYIVSDKPGGCGQEDIWISRRKDSGRDWSDLENIGPAINSKYNEWAPSISFDNAVLFFCSDRPGKITKWNVWFSTRDSDGTGWSEPQEIGEPINSTTNVNNPLLAINDTYLFFSDASGFLPREGGCGRSDIWVSKKEADGVWSIPENVREVNTAFNEVHPFVTIDGLTLFFSSDRPGGFGSRDIWYSTRATVSEKWGTVKNLGSRLNSEANEYELAVSADGKEIYFTSDRDRSNDIYRINIDIRDAN